jgi:hypothetical protein
MQKHLKEDYKMENINVAVVEFGKEPYLKEIPNTLEALKDIVGGYIEMVRLPFDLDLILICNEEGKLMNLPATLNLGHDVICGNFLIARDKGDGDITSLTKYDIDKLNIEFGIELD